MRYEGHTRRAREETGGEAQQRGAVGYLPNGYRAINANASSCTLFPSVDMRAEITITRGAGLSECGRAPRRAHGVVKMQLCNRWQARVLFRSSLAKVSCPPKARGRSFCNQVSAHHRSCSRAASSRTALAAFRLHVPSFAFRMHFASRYAYFHQTAAFSTTLLATARLPLACLRIHIGLLAP